jgi:hypothetical protein
VAAVRRLRALSEQECYCRCYAARDDAVKIVRLPPKERQARLTGERLRLLFERRLDMREPGLAA